MWSMIISLLSIPYETAEIKSEKQIVRYVINALNDAHWFLMGDNREL